MRYFVDKKHAQSLFILCCAAFFLSACASNEELTMQSTESVVACPNFPGLENKCSFDYTREQDFHLEYGQQLLPIQERKEIIEQEIEDALYEQ